MKQQNEINYIIELLARWIAEIKLHNANDYYDINKISENLILNILNTVFDYELVDLNNYKRNFPGVDLGDLTKKFIAFQVTSRTDKSKIIHTLKLFENNRYINNFKNGVRIFILTLEEIKKYSENEFKEFQSFFNPEKDILTINELVKKIKIIYSKDNIKFQKIKKILINEFESDEKRKDELKILYQLLREYFDEIDINLETGINKNILQNKYHKILDYINENKLNDIIINIDNKYEEKYVDDILIFITPTGFEKRRQYFKLVNGMTIAMFCLLFLNSFDIFIRDYETNNGLANFFDFKNKLSFFKEYTGAKLLF